MAKRQLDKAIEQIDGEIAVLQAARTRLVQQRDEQDAKRVGRSATTGLGNGEMVGSRE